jgi:glycosyltransferase involved in cell wall biosynthesis
MIKLSVITINYNNKKGLEKTVQSVLEQEFRDFEYIVVDGASDDGSRDVIKAHEDRISKWVSEKDSGIYNAQNKGLAMAGGDYCLFLNSGDLLADKQVLRKVFSEERKEDILYGDMLVDWGGGKITHEKMHRKVGLYEMYTDTIWHPSAFIRRSLFEKYGNYDERYRIVADYEFFFRAVIAHKASLNYLPYPVAVFGFNGTSSLPENKGKEKAEREQVWKTYMSAAEISAMQKQLEKATAKKRTLFYRIVNKLKG